MKLLIFSFFAALLAYSLLFTPSHKDNHAQEDRALFLVGDTLILIIVNRRMGSLFY